MNSIQVNAQMLANPQNAQMLQNIKNATGNQNLATAAQNGDFFAAFLQSLQGGNVSQVGDVATAILGEQKTQETDENTAAMEMASGLLNGNYGFDWLLPSATSQNDYSGKGEISSNEQNPALAGLQGLGGGQNTELMQILGQTSQGETNSLVNDTGTSSKFLEQMTLLQQAQQASPQTVQQQQVQQQQAIQQQGLPTQENSQLMQQQATGKWQPTQSSKNEFRLYKAEIGNQTESDISSDRRVEISPLATSADQKSSSEQLFNGNMNFQTAVAQAQKALKGKGASIEEQDFQLPQGQQETMQTLNVDTTGIEKAETPKIIDTKDLFEQVKTGLHNGSLTETKELSVKLKPEGLGEVTIKLIKEQNQITVQIVTASEQTAKLLNDQLPNLRQTMQSLQAEVRDVQISQQQNNQQFDQQLNQQFNQQGSEHHGSQNNSFYGNSADNLSANEISNKQEFAENSMDLYA